MKEIISRQFHGKFNDEDSLLMDQFFQKSLIEASWNNVYLRRIVMLLVFLGVISLETQNLNEGELKLLENQSASSEEFASIKDDFSNDPERTISELFAEAKEIMSIGFVEVPEDRFKYAKNKENKSKKIVGIFWDDINKFEKGVAEKYKLPNFRLYFNSTVRTEEEQKELQGHYSIQYEEYEKIYKLNSRFLRDKYGLTTCPGRDEHKKLFQMKQLVDQINGIELYDIVNGKKVPFDASLNPTAVSKGISYHLTGEAFDLNRWMTAEANHISVEKLDEILDKSDLLKRNKNENWHFEISSGSQEKLYSSVGKLWPDINDGKNLTDKHLLYYKYLQKQDFGKKMASTEKKKDPSVITDNESSLRKFITIKNNEVDKKVSRSGKKI